MSHRFPPLASQADLSRRADRRPAAVLVLAEVPSLPWFELIIGAAFLMALQLV